MLAYRNAMGRRDISSQFRAAGGAQPARLDADRRGVTALEYAVIAAVLVGALAGGVASLGTGTSTRLVPLSTLLGGGGTGSTSSGTGGTSGTSGSGTTSPTHHDYWH